LHIGQGLRLLPKMEGMDYVFYERW
jgi:hypothetical protein